MIPEWLAKILEQPTCSVPEAGRAVGIAGRNQAYQAAGRGEIPTLRFGRTLRVPTAWLVKVLDLNELVREQRPDLPRPVDLDEPVVSGQRPRRRGRATRTERQLEPTPLT